MKTIVTLVAAGVLSLGLAACSGSEPANSVEANSAEAGLGEDANLSVVDDSLTADNAGVTNDSLVADPLGNAADLNSSVDGNAAGNASGNAL